MDGEYLAEAEGGRSARLRGADPAWVTAMLGGSVIRGSALPIPDNPPR